MDVEEQSLWGGMSAVGNGEIVTRKRLKTGKNSPCELSHIPIRDFLNNFELCELTAGVPVWSLLLSRRLGLTFQLLY